MKLVQQHINQMNELLDQLIQTARNLKDLSHQIISEDELLPLQRQQETLLSQLAEVDQKIQQYHQTEISKETHQQFHEKISEFQRLNQEFIDGLKAGHGVIQFELQRFKDTMEGGEDLSSFILQRLNKISSSPNSPPTEETEEEK